MEAFATWGGVPRYWELAAAHRDRTAAVRELVLSPLGVLHDEPARLLLDDLRDPVQALSILALIGQGCHRFSEIAGRLGKPAIALTRPLQRLVELGLVRRHVPFAASPRDSKRTTYRIADPFLAFWFRFVEPNRSRLHAGQIAAVADEVLRAFPRHVAEIWEELVRASVARRAYGGHSWKLASPWWGPGLDRVPLEIDVVAESSDGSALLLGEVEWTSRAADRLTAELRAKAARFPLAAGRKVVLAAWIPAGIGTKVGAVPVFGAEQVVGALR